MTTGVASGLRSGANIIITPFSWAVNAIARPVGHTFAGMIDYSDVVAQNEKLRYELGEAEERANQGWAFARQLQQITTQLNVPFVGAIPTVAVQVTALSPTNFAATIQVSKVATAASSPGCRSWPTAVSSGG